MQMTGEQRIIAPRQRVWEALNDPEVLRQCIPGCQSLAKDGDNRLIATVEIKIGPIGARFTGAVTLSDLDPPSGYTISGEGKAGTIGSAKGGAKVRLIGEADETRLSYHVDAQVGGRLAQLGGPIIDATAARLAAQFFEKFGVVVGGRDESAVPAASAASSRIASAASPTIVAASSAPSGLPVSWILALAVAALTGFLVGRGQAGAQGSDWMGLAIGLLVIIVAAAGFQFGRSEK
jgi:carbon monoxide dehydrogenase subunit G